MLLSRSTCLRMRSVAVLRISALAFSTSNNSEARPMMFRGFLKSWTMDRAKRPTSVRRSGLQHFLNIMAIEVPDAPA